MHRACALVFVTVLAFPGSATAPPVMPFHPDRSTRTVESLVPSDDGAYLLVQARQRGGGGDQRGGGGGRQRAAGGANRGSFNSNKFQRDVAGPGNRNAAANRNVNRGGNRNVDTNRNVNATANRNVVVNGGGGCCYESYDSGPSWGGVAAGVAAGAVLGAAVSSAASSPAYVVPPPTYRPGYVSPPPY